MKTFIPLTALFTATLFLCLFNTSCKKEDKDHSGPKETLIVHSWTINRIQLKLFNGSVFVKDTILKQTPKPRNFAAFGADMSFEYCFNSMTKDPGTYVFKGADSIIATAASGTYRWKLLMLTDQLFTTMTTTNNDPDFPGYKVERYYTLVP